MDDLKVYVYDDDGYAGQLGGGTRRVTITGTMTYNEPFWRTFSGVRQDLIDRFTQRAGWGIVNLDLLIGSGWNDFTTVPAGFNLTADVPDDFSNEAHLQQAYKILGDYSVTALSTVHVFTNVNLQITGQQQSGYTPPQTTTISGTPTPIPGSNSNSGGSSNNNYFPTAAEIAAAIQGAANPATQLFGGVGVTTMAVAGVLILVVLARR